MNGSLELKGNPASLEFIPHFLRQVLGLVGKRLPHRNVAANRSLVDGDPGTCLTISKMF